MRKKIKYTTYEADPAELAIDKVQQKIDKQLRDDTLYQSNKEAISEIVSELYNILDEISDQVVWRDRDGQVTTVFGRRKEPKSYWLKELFFNRRGTECYHEFKILDSYRIVTVMRHNEICFDFYRGAYGGMNSKELMEESMSLDEVIDMVTDEVADRATAKYNKELIKGA